MRHTPCSRWLFLGMKTPRDFFYFLLPTLAPLELLIMWRQGFKHAVIILKAKNPYQRGIRTLCLDKQKAKATKQNPNVNLSRLISGIAGQRTLSGP